jgi:dephospho-CoA kinase
MKSGDHAAPPAGTPGAPSPAGGTSASPGAAPSGPAPRPFILKVGLTGGIATGKTTVARQFAERGAAVADADAFARALVEPGAAGYEPVVREFGAGIVTPDGGIDRPALARIVFSDPARRARLEAILHPLILAEEEAFIARLATQGGARIAVINAALLFEAGTWRRYHRIVVVHCSEAMQIDRLTKRDGLGRDEALARIRSQMSAAEKVNLGHYAIDTSEGFGATEARVREVWRHLEHDLAAISAAD